MKLLAIAICCIFAVKGDEYDDRIQNAIDVSNAGLAACRLSNVNGPQRNTVPYLTPDSYLTNAVKIMGGVLKIYHNRKMKKEIKHAFQQLNQRFDQLEIDIHAQIAELKGYIDRKQFQTDIEDPTSILWGEMLAYVEYPNNETEANMKFECVRQTPWQIAMKLRNRFIGPDNSMMTQIQSDKWSNSSFMATKDVVMTKIFQLMTIQSFCVGVKNGPNVNITEEWSIQRMYHIYSDIVNALVSSRIAQERDYFQAVIPDLVKTTVTDNSHKNYQDYATKIYNTLTSTYTWDRFLVVVADTNCDHLGEQHVVQDSEKGYSPYATIQFSHNNVDVFVIRYWIGQYAPYSRKNTYISCMQSAYNSDPIKWAQSVYCAQSYNILVNNWFCGVDTKFAPSSTGMPEYFYAVSDVSSNNGFSSAVWPASTRMTTVEYDLGFWERPISIKLMSPNN